MRVNVVFYNGSGVVRSPRERDVLGLIGPRHFKDVINFVPDAFDYAQWTENKNMS